MEDGIHQLSPTEAILVRSGRTVRRIVIQGGLVEVTRAIPLGSDDQLADLFDVQLRELQDDWSGTIRCAFCEKTSAEAPTLIAGPTCYICSECVTVCAGIIETP